MPRYPSRPNSAITNDTADNLAGDTGIQTAAEENLYVTTNLVSWEMVKAATTEDPTLVQLKEMIEEGLTDNKPMPGELKHYQRYRDQLSVMDGVIMLGQRIVIPKLLRNTILSSLHAAHQGIGAMCKRASDTVFWPGITIDISRTRDQCQHCHRIAKSHAMTPPEEIILPDYPFQKICCDYFAYESSNYLVVVDRYSNWPIVFKENGKAEKLVSRLRDIFTTFGVPEDLTSDGGPQFTAGITKDFLLSWGSASQNLISW